MSYHCVNFQYTLKLQNLQNLQKSAKSAKSAKFTGNNVNIFTKNTYNKKI
jgi:hypothetical protein